MAVAFVSIGNALAGQGKFKEETRILRKALKITRRVFGEDNHEVAKVLTSIGTSFRCAGKFQKGLDTFAKVLAMNYRALGVDNLDNGMVHLKMSLCQSETVEPVAIGSVPEGFDACLQAALESARSSVRIHEMHGAKNVFSEEASHLLFILSKADSIRGNPAIGGKASAAAYLRGLVHILLVWRPV